MKKYSAIFILLFLISCSAQPIEDKTTETAVEKITEPTVEVNINEEDSLILFQIYGELAPVGYLDEENPITEAYGFTLKRVAGCEVEETMVNDVLMQNNHALKAMNLKYGDDWKKKFEAETEFKLAIPFF